MMRRHRLHPVYPAVLLSLACGGHRSPGNLPAPTPAPPQPAPAVPTPNALMFTPGTTRYLVRQDVHGQQDYAGMPPTYDLRYAIYLTAVIALHGLALAAIAVGLSSLVTKVQQAKPKLADEKTIFNVASMILILYLVISLVTIRPFYLDYYNTLSGGQKNILDNRLQRAVLRFWQRTKSQVPG